MVSESDAQTIKCGLQTDTSLKLELEDHSHCDNCIKINKCRYKNTRDAACPIVYCIEGCGFKFHRCKTDEHKLLCAHEKVKWILRKKVLILIQFISIAGLFEWQLILEMGSTLICLWFTVFLGQGKSTNSLWKHFSLQLLLTINFLISLLFLTSSWLTSTKITKFVIASSLFNTELNTHLCFLIHSQIISSWKLLNYFLTESREFRIFEEKASKS